MLDLNNPEVLTRSHLAQIANDLQAMSEELKVAVQTGNIEEIVDVHNRLLEGLAAVTRRAEHVSQFVSQLDK